MIRGILLSVFVIIVATTSLWVNQHIESKIEMINIGYSDQAISNPFLAADKFLNALKIPTQQIHHLASKLPLLKSTDTLLLLGYRQLMSNNTAQQLMQWVKTGGRLIITSKPHYENISHIDHLLAPLQLSVIDNIQQDITTESANPKKLFSNAITATPLSIELDFDPVLILSPSSKQLAYWWYGNDNAMHAALFRQKNGQLVILTDFNIFANENIAFADHAEFLRIITRLRSKNERVFYHLPPNIPSIFQWTWDNAARIILSIGLLLMAVLWHTLLPKRPLVIGHTPRHNQFLLHLQAIGYYHWQHGNVIQLIEPIRQNVLDQLKHKHPSILALTPAQQYERMSQLSAQSIEQVEYAFLNKAFMRTQPIIITIKILENIRKAL